MRVPTKVVVKRGVEAPGAYARTAGELPPYATHMSPLLAVARAATPASEMELERGVVVGFVVDTT